MKNFNVQIKIIYFVFFVYFSVTGPLKPFGNWDMLAYVGSAKGFLNSGMNIREDSLVDVKHYVSINQFQSFLQGSDYIETVATDDLAFKEQLQGYSVKSFYILLIALTSLLTGNISFSSVIVSSLSFFIIGTTLFFMRPESKKTSGYLPYIYFACYVSR
jgi:hypothetical protein